MFKKIITKEEIPQLVGLSVELSFLIGNKMVEIQDLNLMLYDGYCCCYHDVTDDYITKHLKQYNALVGLVKEHMFNSMKQPVTYLWDRIDQL